MSEEKKLSCSVCHAYLFPEDDVVYCPECGAPHHRDCYNSLGHCGLEQLHGTDRQYDKVKHEQQEQEEKQAKQQQEYSQNTDTNWQQHNPYGNRFNNTVYFDLLGGVPKDYQIDDGVTAEEAKNFVISNTMRYIPKFAKLTKNSKISWNFMAFFFPCGWFFSRKMYKNGIIAGIASIIATLLSLPLYNTIYNLGISTASPSYEMAQLLMQNMANISTGAMMAAFIGMWVSLAVSLISALFGDWLYKSHTVKSIKDIRQNSFDIEHDFRKKGGVSLIMFFVGLLAVEYIPSIIAMFI